jgi:hypothetical protein
MNTVNLCSLKIYSMIFPLHFLAKVRNLKASTMKKKLDSNPRKNSIFQVPQNLKLREMNFALALTLHLIHPTKVKKQKKYLTKSKVAEEKSTRNPKAKSPKKFSKAMKKTNKSNTNMKVKKHRKTKEFLTN